MAATTIPSWENIFLRLQAALADDSHEFWDRFHNIMIDDDSESMSDLQGQIQTADDRQRSLQNLPPRPWSEIDAEIMNEGESQREEEHQRQHQGGRNSAYDELLRWDTQVRREKGLEPR
ncbi:MAG: hypothetical protein Q9210_007634, partial [Variospora velana]